MSKLLFFDIETFKYNAFVVFKNINYETVAVFHNDFTGLEELIKDHVLIGYNNYWYDDVILHMMLDLKPVRHIKEMNDRIIGGEKITIKNYRFESLDCFQQIDVSRPSLKKIESNMGRAIVESSVPFDLDRELTEDEYKSVLRYCEYDVSTTIDIYKLREKDYFEPKKEIVKMLDNSKAIRWNTTTLSANVLTDKQMTRWSDIRVPESIMQLVPVEVQELWRTKEKGKVVIREFDNEITFGFGGLHSENVKKKQFENVKLLDVTSLYPSLMVLFRILGIATERYKEILDERIRIKHTHPEKQGALKLILNSVYGLLKSEYSKLYNPKASTTVCALGQALLYELAKRLSVTCEIVQINTDGVAFVPFDDSWKTVASEWEKEFSLQLEEENYLKFYQRDVNNYIAVTHDGKIKTKGGDVNRYHKDALFKNNNTRIVDIAIVDYLVHGKDVITTLLENMDNPKLYQMTLVAGRTFKGTYDNRGQKRERFNRIFAAKKGDLCLYKRRQDNADVRFPDSPESMFIENGDCAEIQDFSEKLDVNHYYQLIQKKLERWA